MGSFDLTARIVGCTMPASISSWERHTYALGPFRWLGRLLLAFLEICPPRRWLWWRH